MTDPLDSLDADVYASLQEETHTSDVACLTDHNITGNNSQDTVTVSKPSADDADADADPTLNLELEEDKARSQAEGDAIARAMVDCEIIMLCTFCTACNSKMEYQSNGFAICTNRECGQICDSILDHSPEWRFYGADDATATDPSRCGPAANPYMKDAAFGCRINNIKRCSREMYRIGKYTEWMTPYDQKVLYKDFQHITHMSRNAGITKNIIDTSFMYYKRFIDYDQSFRGDNKDGLLAAATYTACRVHNCPRSTKELAAIYHISPATVTHGCKLAQQILNEVESDMGSSNKTVFSTLRPQDFIERYCSRLEFESDITSLCIFIATKVDTMQFMAENTPNSIAAGIVYFVAAAFKLNITKAQVSTVSELSGMTINKCYKKLVPLTEQLIPSVMMKKYKGNKG